MKRIGILTSGGDCPGLNAVIRGAVKSCHHLGYDCIGFLKGYEGLYDPVQYVHLTEKNTAGILNRGGTILGSTNKGRFAATVGVQDRVEIDADLIAGVKETVSQLGIDGLICVGGDGSLAVAQQFHEQGIPVVGVPKTIDNDLSATAFTFGFDSAIECATDALDRLHTTAASHERIMVLEVMGRHAGWIALHSGIAGGGDVILIPEVKWNFDHICHKIMHRESQGKKFTLIVVAEGAELPEGGTVGKQVDGQQMRLGGVGRAVVEEIESRLHREARLCVLGHLQRGGTPTTFDRVLATQFGAHAVRLIKEERFGEMICSRPPEMVSVPIMEAVNELRQVNPNGPAMQAARALGISFGDRPADGCGLKAFDEVVTDEQYDESTVVTEIEGEAQTTEVAAETTVPTVEEVVAEEVVTEATTVEETVTEETAVEPTVAEVAPVAEAAIEEVTTVEEVTEEVAEEVTPEVAEEETATEELVAEEPATEEVAVEEVTVEEIATEEVAVEETVTEVAEVEVTEEDTTAEEELASDVLDLVAETDEAAHGSVDTTEETVEEEAEETATEEAAEEATVEPTTEEATTEKPTAQTLAPMTLEVDLAELVKQKLEAAAIKLDEPEEDVVSETKPEPLAAPASTPFEEDLLSEARSALEEALSE